MIVLAVRYAAEETAAQTISSPEAAEPEWPFIWKPFSPPSFAVKKSTRIILSVDRFDLNLGIGLSVAHLAFFTLLGLVGHHGDLLALAGL